MDDFTNYFKNLGTQKPYLFALAPAAAVFVLNYGYISKSSSKDAMKVTGLDDEYNYSEESVSYMGVYKITMMLAAVFYISLFSTLLYIYKEECDESYKDAAKKASIVALVPTVVLLVLFMFLGRRNATGWVSSVGSAWSVQLTQLLAVFVLALLTINYVITDCKKVNEQNYE